METVKMEETVLGICEIEGWDLLPYKDLAKATEELGELAREIRRIEDGRERPDETEPAREEMIPHLAEELGDVLFPLIKIAAYYGVTLEDCFNNHIAKMIAGRLTVVKETPSSLDVDSLNYNKKDSGEPIAPISYYQAVRDPKLAVEIFGTNPVALSRVALLQKDPHLADIVSRYIAVKNDVKWEYKATDKSQGGLELRHRTVGDFVCDINHPIGTVEGTLAEAKFAFVADSREDVEYLLSEIVRLNRLVDSQKVL